MRASTLCSIDCEFAAGRGDDLADLALKAMAAAVEIDCHRNDRRLKVMSHAEYGQSIAQASRCPQPSARSARQHKAWGKAKRTPGKEITKNEVSLRSGRQPLVLVFPANICPPPYEHSSTGCRPLTRPTALAKTICTDRGTNTASDSPDHSAVARFAGYIISVRTCRRVFQSAKRLCQSKILS